MIGNLLLLCLCKYTLTLFTPLLFNEMWSNNQHSAGIAVVYVLGVFRLCVYLYWPLDVRHALAMFYALPAVRGRWKLRYIIFIPPQGSKGFHIVIQYCSLGHNRLINRSEASSVFNALTYWPHFMYFLYFFSLTVSAAGRLDFPERINKVSKFRLWFTVEQCCSVELHLSKIWH